MAIARMEGSVEGSINNVGKASNTNAIMSGGYGNEYAVWWDLVLTKVVSKHDLVEAMDVIGKIFSMMSLIALMKE